MTASIRLREARPDDCRSLHELANEPQARAMSFTQQSIESGEHRRWFDRKLADPYTSIYLALDEADRVIGFARFEKKREEVCISVALDRSFRGKGLGAQLIALAVEKYRERDDDRIRAYIRKENRISQKAFQNAGFRYHSESVINGLDAVCLEFA